MRVRFHLLMYPATEGSERDRSVPAGKGSVLHIPLRDREPRRWLPPRMSHASRATADDHRERTLLEARQVNRYLRFNSLRRMWKLPVSCVRPQMPLTGKGEMSMKKILAGKDIGRERSENGGAREAGGKVEMRHGISGKRGTKLIEPPKPPARRGTAHDNAAHPGAGSAGQRFGIDESNLAVRKDFMRLDEEARILLEELIPWARSLRPG